MNFRALIVVGALIACATASGQTFKEEGRLFDKPSGTAQGASISAGTRANVIERQGFWIFIQVGGRSGWIKASALSFSSGGSGPTAIDTGRLGSGNIVSTSAARGLSAKDLLTGTPRIDEVVKMAQFSSDAAAVRQFASEGLVVAISKDVSLSAKPLAEDKRSASGHSPKASTKNGADDW